MKKKHLTINVKGLDWSIYVQTKSAYTRNHGSDSSAITYPSSREVYFNKYDISIGLIRHELLHVFVSSNNVTSSRLSPAQIEELCCEIVQDHFRDIDMLSEKVLNFALG